MQPLKVEELSPNELDRVISQHLGNEKCLDLINLSPPSVCRLSKIQRSSHFPFSQDSFLAWELLDHIQKEVQFFSIVPVDEGFETSLLTLDGEHFTYKSSEDARAIAVVAVKYIGHKHISDIRKVVGASS